MLRTAIDELPADYRAVVMLHNVEGFSHQEIADSLGLEAHLSIADVESMPSVAGTDGSGLTLALLSGACK